MATLMAIAMAVAGSALAQSDNEPPYDQQLLRLSEILGAMHYLRPLCGADENGVWRNQMQALIEAEQPTGYRRERFVDAFNRGYESYRSVYRSCTVAATETIDRYMKEGAKIAQEVTTRYAK